VDITCVHDKENRPAYLLSYVRHLNPKAIAHQESSTKVATTPAMEATVPSQQYAQAYSKWVHEGPLIELIEPVEDNSSDPMMDQLFEALANKEFELPF
jgi:hypothetical protein